MIKLLKELAAEAVLSVTGALRRRRAAREQELMDEQRQSVHGPTTEAAIRGFSLLFESPPPNDFGDIYYQFTGSAHYVSFAPPHIDALVSFVGGTYWDHTLRGLPGSNRGGSRHSDPPQWPLYWPISPTPLLHKAGWPDHPFGSDWAYIFLADTPLRFYLATGTTPADKRARYGPTPNETANDRNA